MNAEALHHLAASPNWGERCKAARDPELPSGLVEQLANDPAWEVQVVIAGRPVLPAGILAKLQSSRDWRVRYAAQRRDNPNVQP